MVVQSPNIFAHNTDWWIKHWNPIRSGRHIEKGNFLCFGKIARLMFLIKVFMLNKQMSFKALIPYHAWSAVTQ